MQKNAQGKEMYFEMRHSIRLTTYTSLDLTSRILTAVISQVDTVDILTGSFGLLAHFSRREARQQNGGVAVDTHCFPPVNGRWAVIYALQYVPRTVRELFTADDDHSSRTRSVPTRRLRILHDTLPSN